MSKKYYSNRAVEGELDLRSKQKYIELLLTHYKKDA